MTDLLLIEWLELVSVYPRWEHHLETSATYQNWKFAESSAPKFSTTSIEVVNVGGRHAPAWVLYVGPVQSSESYATAAEAIIGANPPGVHNDVPLIPSSNAENSEAQRGPQEGR